MMYHYHPVLISYPLGDPSDKRTPWSGLTWCQIEKDDTDHIHIRVPEPGKMLSSERFKELTSFECARIRVIDLSNREPVYYCLSLTDTLHRFDFSCYGILQPRGKKWTPEENPNIWSETDIVINKTMKSDGDYHALTLAYSTGIPARDDTWLLPILTAQQEEFRRQQALEEGKQALSKLHDIWLTTRKNEPISFEGYSDSVGRLNPTQRQAIQTQLIPRLQYIKNLSNSEDTYANALCNILNRQGYAGILECNGEETKTHEDNLDQNYELELAVNEFHSQFLHPPTLNALYPNFYTADTRQPAAQPVRQDVHNYILDLVFYELKKYQPQYLYQSFEREPCPKNYATQRINHNPDRENQLDQFIQQSHNPIPSKPTRNSYAYRQVLPEKRKSIGEILLDEQVLINPRLRTEIITSLINDPSQLTQLGELLELLEYLTLDEVVDATTQLSDDKLLCYAQDITAFTQLLKSYPVLLPMLNERYPQNYAIQFSVLDVTIQRIKPEYQPLAKQAKQVFRELKALHSINPSQELLRTIQLTVQVLQSPPDEKRLTLLEQYETYASHIARHHPAQYWRKLGIAMAILGSLMAAVGGGLLLTGIVATTTAGAFIACGSVAGSLGLLGVFHHRSQTQTLHNFIDCVKNCGGVI